MARHEHLALIESQEWVLGALREDAPDYLTAADALGRNLGHLARAQPRGTAAHDVARHMLANHLVNDGLELLTSSFYGLGRSMLRSSRSLFETAVNSSDIPTSNELAERYVAQESVTELAGSRLVRLDRYLSKKGRKARRHQRHKVERDTAGPIRDAKARWGSRWATSWAPRTLRDRAESAGLASDYESFYRLASSPTHGGAGGLIGTRNKTDRAIINRFGPSLEACVIAIGYGIEYLELATEGLGPHPEVDPVLEAIDGVRQQVTSYGAVILALDDSLWPDDPPPDRIAVLMVQLGQERWLYHDLVMGKIVDAHPPEEVPPGQRRFIDERIQDARLTAPEMQEPLTIAVLGVQVVPKAGAEWVDDRIRLPRQPLIAPAEPSSIPPDSWAGSGG